MLDEERRRAVLERRLDLLRLVDAGEDDDLDFRVALADLAKAGQTVHLRHADIEQDEIRLCSPDQWKRLAARQGLADQLDVLGLLQREPDRIEHQLVVVDNDNAYLSHCRSPFYPPAPVAGNVR